MQIEKLIGAAIVVSVVGPLFWLGINSLEGYLIKRGVTIAGLDLFSRQSWREYLIRRRTNSRSGHTGTQKRLG